MTTQEDRDRVERRLARNRAASAVLSVIRRAMHDRGCTWYFPVNSCGVLFCAACRSILHVDHELDRYVEPCWQPDGYEESDATPGA